MELVYKLNLPPITELMLDSAKETIFNPNNSPFHKSFKANEVMNSVGTSIKQLPWSNLIVFYKPDFLGTIHVDDNAQIRDITRPCIWGINFIHGGSAVMEYWKNEDIETTKRVADAVGTYNLQCETTKPPYTVYYMGPGAYLVNASHMHRVRGIGKRYALALRPNSSLGFTWDKITEKFQDLIVDWPGHEESNLDL